MAVAGVVVIVASMVLIVVGVIVVVANMIMTSVLIPNASGFAVGDITASREGKAYGQTKAS